MGRLQGSVGNPSRDNSTETNDGIAHWGEFRYGWICNTEVNIDRRLDKTPLSSSQNDYISTQGLGLSVYNRFQDNSYFNCQNSQQ